MVRTTLAVVFAFVYSVAICADSPPSISWEEVPANGDADFSEKATALKAKYDSKQVRLTGPVVSIGGGNNRVTFAEMAIQVPRGEVKATCRIQLVFSDKDKANLQRIAGKVVTVEGTGSRQAAYQYPFSIRDCEVAVEPEEAKKRRKRS